MKGGQEKIATQVNLPSGYTGTWGGSFENMERAMAKLRVIVPITGRDEQAANQAATDFVRSLYGALRQHLPA
mgnify:CR=1 FL=1